MEKIIQIIIGLIILPLLYITLVTGANYLIAKLFLTTFEEIHYSPIWIIWIIIGILVITVYFAQIYDEN
jgi:hypothetical protein